MKWVKLVAIILSALIGFLLIGYGGLLAFSARIISPPVSVVIGGIGGGVLFLYALIFSRQIARPIHIVGKYFGVTGKHLWATKYGRWGLILCTITIIAVGTLLAVWAQYREIPSALQYDGHTWNTMSSNTSERLIEVWGSSASEVFAVGIWGTLMNDEGHHWVDKTSGATEIL